MFRDTTPQQGDLDVEMPLYQHLMAMIIHILDLVKLNRWHQSSYSRRHNGQAI